MLTLSLASIILCGCQEASSPPTIKAVDLLGEWTGQLEPLASPQDLKRIKSTSHKITFTEDRKFMAQGLLSIKDRSGFDAEGEWVISQQNGTTVHLVCSTQILRQYEPAAFLSVEFDDSGNIILRYAWDDPDMYDDIIFSKKTP